MCSNRHAQKKKNKAADGMMPYKIEYCLHYKQIPIPIVYPIMHVSLFVLFFFILPSLFLLPFLTLASANLLLFLIY